MSTGLATAGPGHRRMGAEDRRRPRTWAPAAPFRTTVDFSCGGCHQPGHRGELVAYYGGLVCHAECRPITDDFIDQAYAQDAPVPEPEPAYVVKGARKVPHCPKCHCNHRGECW